MPWLHGILKILGGAYLIYLGIALWRSAGQQAPMQACAPAASSRGAFRRGFLVNLLNPKSAAYYGSVFAMFMGPSTPGWVQIAAIALITLGSVLWHTALALVFSTAGMQRTYAAVWRPINRLGGILMTALGARLVLARD